VQIFLGVERNHHHDIGSWPTTVTGHLWLIRRSIRNFNIPPRAYPGHLTVHRARGRGEFERIYLLFWRNMPVSFFRFLQGLTDRQDRISSRLVNNSFKRVFKRSLKVSLRYISLWKACKVFDWRRNLSLRRGISVLIGRAFERLFCPEGGGEFEQANLQNFKCPGGLPGGGCWTFELIGGLWLRFPWPVTRDLRPATRDSWSVTRKS